MFSSTDSPSCIVFDYASGVPNKRGQTLVVPEQDRRAARGLWRDAEHALDQDSESVDDVRFVAGGRKRASNVLADLLPTGRGQ